MVRPVTDRLIVRQGQIADAQALLAFVKSNRDHHQPTSPLRYKSCYKLKHQEGLLDTKDASKMLFLLFDKGNDGCVIGSISLTQISLGAFCSCYPGYGMDAGFTGSGLMTEALGAVIDYVFSAGELHRIQANVIPGNTSSARILEKLGFQREGFHKKYSKINGKWEDHVSYAPINPCYND
jgi:ribosomal-protein-alanine N-acetyltransferase